MANQAAGLENKSSATYKVLLKSQFYSNSESQTFCKKLQILKFKIRFLLNFKLVEEQNFWILEKMNGKAKESKKFKI